MLACNTHLELENEQEGAAAQLDIVPAGLIVRYRLLRRLANRADTRQAPKAIIVRRSIVRLIFFPSTVLALLLVFASGT